MLQICIVAGKCIYFKVSYQYLNYLSFTKYFSQLDKTQHLKLPLYYLLHDFNNLRSQSLTFTIKILPCLTMGIWNELYYAILYKQNSHVIYTIETFINTWYNTTRKFIHIEKSRVIYLAGKLVPLFPVQIKINDINILVPSWFVK